MVGERQNDAEESLLPGGQIGEFLNGSVEHVEIARSPVLVHESGVLEVVSSDEPLHALMPVEALLVVPGEQAVIEEERFEAVFLENSGQRPEGLLAHRPLGRPVVVGKIGEGA